MKPVITVLAAILVSCLLAAGISSAAPDMKATELLQKHMAVIRESDISKTNRDDIPRILAADPCELFPILAANQKDKKREVRMEAHSLAWRLGAASKDRKVRTECVKQLAGGLSDAAAIIWQDNARRLVGFNSDEFDLSSKAQVSTTLKNPARATYAAVVAGAAGMTDIIPELRKLSTAGGVSGKPTKTANYAKLALARLGSRKDIEYVVKIANSKPSILEKIRVIPLMMYIRQPEGTAFVRSILESDERLSPMKEIDPGTPCNQYALDAMANLLEGVPVQPKGGIGSFTEEDLQLARDWVKQQTKFTYRKWTGTYFPDVL